MESHPYRIIGLEEHTCPPELWQALDDGSDESITIPARRPGLKESLWEAGPARLARMDEAGVDVQVLSVPPPGTQNLDAAEAVALARHANDFLAEHVSAQPNRFAAFATLPTPDPEAAATELQRSVTQLGMVGALVFPRSGEFVLDDERFAPIFEVAAELHVPLYVHPQLPPQAVRDVYYSGFSEEVSYVLAAHGWGWHDHAGLAALRLILAGTLDRHPDLQLILGHWGELLVPFVDRLDVLSPVATHLERRVGEYITGNTYVTPGGIYSHRMLVDASAAVGADRVLFAADDPYVPTEPGAARNFLATAPISPDDKRKIGEGNAERLLSLPTTAAVTA